jgi:adenylate cyclase
MKTITAAVLASVMLIILYQPVFFAAWDQKTKDLIASWVDKGSLSDKVEIVEIDDKSLSAFGRWPWPRDRLSMLLKKIQDAGADTVVVDLMFPEADLGLPRGMPGAGGAGNPSAKSLGQQFQTNDELLAATLHRGRFITGFLLRFPPETAGTTPCMLRPLSFVQVDPEVRSNPVSFSAQGAICSLAALSQSSLGTGFLNAAPDRDGILRRVPLVAEFNKDMYPSLAFSAYLNYRRIRGVQMKTNSSGAESLRVGENVVPVDSRSDLMLRFRGKAGRFQHVSAAGILTGDLSMQAFQGKVVVVGVSAMGLKDTVATPFASSFPGYEVQATAIDNLIQGDSLRVPREALAGELLLLLLMAIGSGFLLGKLDPIWATPLVLSLVGAVWISCTLLLATTRIVFSPFPATLVLTGNLALLNVWRVSTERLRWEKQLGITRRFILNALTSLTNIHDVETGAHVVRVQRYAKRLCEALAPDPQYRRILKPKTIQLIYELIPIHDIGKVSIPDSILRKPARLTPEEFEIIKTHVSNLKKVFFDAVESSGLKDETTLNLASDIILTHHERWDGSGYPEGLRGDRIPLVGRIVAVVDVYDALVSKRVYKEPMSHESAIEYICENRGTQFDPKVVDALMGIEEAIRQIRTECEDE